MTGADEGRRGLHRDGVLRSAKLVVGGSVVDCVVLDVSARGARVRLAAMMVLPREVRLCLRGGASFSAEVRWARAQEAGLLFLGETTLGAGAAAAAGEALAGVRGGGLGAVLEGLERARYFDDPGLAEVAGEVRVAVARLEAALARLAAGTGPDVFS